MNDTFTVTLAPCITGEFIKQLRLDLLLFQLLASAPEAAADMGGFFARRAKEIEKALEGSQ